MPIDISIQFNGHNSYRVTETIWCAPFGVEGMAYVTHSFHAYAASALGAATRARTRFFAANGSITGTTDHSFTVPVVFTEVDITVAVPANSVLCQVAFFTSGTWWIAEPKSEEGQAATPYNTNYAGQLSMITPDGAYLGMLTTQQIVVAGTLADPTESLYARLITINNNAITLAATSADHGSRITTVEAGQITLTSQVGSIAPKVTRITSEGIYTGEVVADQITTGMLSSVGDVSWINMDNGNFSFASGRLTYDGTELSILGSVVSESSAGTAELSAATLTFKNAAGITKGALSYSTISDSLYLYAPAGTTFDLAVARVNAPHTAPRANGIYDLGDSTHSWYDAYLYRIRGHGGDLRVDANVLPITNNVVSLGNIGYKWTAVYAQNGTIQTSSRNSKHDIGDILTTETRKQMKGLKKRYKKNVFIDETGRTISGTTHEGLLCLLDKIADKLVTFTYDGPEGTRQLGIIADDLAGEPEFEHIGEKYTAENGDISYGIKPLSMTMLAIAGYRNLRERLNTIEAKQREGRT